MSANTYPRRVLLAVTGLTPQIVTETLYALAVAQAEPWIPTEIRLVTTAEGAERARLSLLDPKDGQFHALCRDYGLTGQIAFAPANIMVIRDANGTPLTDIRTPADNTLAADALLAEVRTLCGDDTCALHVSIAGGRKTMGFFLGYALSLFGRSQDRLSHVLVNEPFEALREFYFPPAEPCVLHTEKGRPIHTADARVMLAEIPFVRLRDGLPREALAHGAPFASMVSTAQLAIDPPALRFDLKGKALWCGNQAVALPPALLAWYAWLAQCRSSGVGEDGFVRHSDVSPEAYLKIYETVLGRGHSSLEQARLATRDGLDATQFEQKRSKINRHLAAALSLAATPYKVCSRGRRPLTRYGIDLPPGRIVIA
ncbi:MAG: CRISPR-associated ring nuclease Csm6 [Betaproteobacteria bacterium]